MSTRPIGPGTRNLSVNVRAAVHRTLGRLAFRRDVSMGEYVRRILARAYLLARSSKLAVRDAEADAEAARIIRKACADGIGPEDAQAFDRALQLIEQSEQDARQLRLALTP